VQVQSLVGRERPTYLPSLRRKMEPSPGPFSARPSVPPVPLAVMKLSTRGTLKANVAPVKLCYRPKLIWVVYYACARILPGTLVEVG
jgi:hypothetical protein